MKSKYFLQVPFIGYVTSFTLFAWQKLQWPSSSSITDGSKNLLIASGMGIFRLMGIENY